MLKALQRALNNNFFEIFMTIFLSFLPLIFLCFVSASTAVELKI